MSLCKEWLSPGSTVVQHSGELSVAMGWFHLVMLPVTASVNRWPLHSLTVVFPGWDFHICCISLVSEHGSEGKAGLHASLATTILCMGPRCSEAS